jgi:ATP-dependent Clp protease ATP-binding subunit ClpA
MNNIEEKSEVFDMPSEQKEKVQAALARIRHQALEKYLSEAKSSTDPKALKEQYETIRERFKNDPGLLAQIKAVYLAAQRRFRAISVCDYLSDTGFVWPLASPSMALVGRDQEIELLRESLLKRRMKNSILVGEAGCGKTAIVEEFASRFEAEYAVVSLDIAGLLTNTKYRGEFEDKFMKFMNKVQSFEKKFGAKRKLVIFIDEIHMIYAAGRTDEDVIDLANMLKGHLSHGEIIIIGATTPEEYEKTIRKDKALNRRLSPIFINELGKDAVIQIVDQFAGHVIGQDLLNYIYVASQKIPEGCNPDCSIEIADRLLARQEATGEIIDANMVDTIVNYLLRTSLEKKGN